MNDNSISKTTIITLYVSILIELSRESSTYFYVVLSV